MLKLIILFRLGKTIQIIAFLSGMFDQGLVETALIVVPKSLMENWINEFQKWYVHFLLHYSEVKTAKFGIVSFVAGVLCIFLLVNHA